MMAAIKGRGIARLAHHRSDMPATPQPPGIKLSTNLVVISKLDALSLPWHYTPFAAKCARSPSRLCQTCRDSGGYQRSHTKRHRTVSPQGPGPDPARTGSRVRRPSILAGGRSMVTRDIVEPPSRSLVGQYVTRLIALQFNFWSKHLS